MTDDEDARREYLDKVAAEAPPLTPAILDRIRRAIARGMTEDQPRTDERAAPVTHWDHMTWQ